MDARRRRGEPPDRRDPVQFRGPPHPGPRGRAEVTGPATGTKLSPVTVARFEQTTILIERLANEKTSLFLEGLTGHLNDRHQAAARPLTHNEAASVAGQLAVA